MTPICSSYLYNAVYIYCGTTLFHRTGRPIPQHTESNRDTTKHLSTRQWRIYGGAIGRSPPPLETVWGGILSACSAENAAPKSANNVFQRLRRSKCRPKSCKQCFRLPNAVWGRHFERLQRWKCRPQKCKQCFQRLRRHAAPKRANNVFDYWRRFVGGILSACSAENATPKACIQSFSTVWSIV